MTQPASPILCTRCGTQIAPAMLSCPACQSLVHAAQLNQLAAEAQQKEQSQDVSGAAALWRQALSLLPPQSQQHQVITEKLAALSARIDAGETSRNPDQTLWKKGAAGAGALALLLWKLKFAVVFILTKGKLLLLGLTNMGTLLSMMLSLGVYWSIWGWKFALGLVVSIYIHEMGHVAALRRFGFAATAPMFVPGLGAMIRLRQQPVSGREDARIGLAGPMWGLGAAVVAAGVWLMTHDPFWAAIAQVGAWINLFNLLPMKPLDGGRGFSALSRWQAWLIAAAIAGVWIWTGEGLLALLLAVAVLNALAKRPDAPADQTATIQFLFLLVTLSMMCRYVGGHPVGRLAATQPTP